MSRAISTNLKNHKAQRVTTLCKCWRILRADGVNEAWTEHDRTLSINTGVGEGALSYLPIPSGIPSNYRQGADLSPANMDIEMAYGGDAEDQVRSGLYDWAQIWTFEVNWADLTQGILKLAYGRIGAVSLGHASSRCEVRGLAQLLSTQIGDCYLSECPATLGDAKCKIDLTAFTHAGVVNVVTSRRQFTISGAAAIATDNYYNYGLITFSTGLNAGRTVQVERYYASTVTVLLEPLPYLPANGDAFTATRGCDRRLATCQGFVSVALQGSGTTEGSGLGNRKNFRGHPGLPGPDKIFNVPANTKWTSG